MQKIKLICAITAAVIFSLFANVGVAGNAPMKKDCHCAHKCHCGKSNKNCKCKKRHAHNRAHAQKPAAEAEAVQ